MTRDRQTDRQTSAPFHDMATRSGPHNNLLCAVKYEEQRQEIFVQSNVTDTLSAVAGP